MTDVGKGRLRQLLPEVSAADLSWLMMCAVRYSMGRTSFAPSYTAEMVIRYMEAITRDERRLMAEEIRRYLGRYHADTNHVPDIRTTWEDLATALEAP
jgi:hypothetical protein